LRSSSPCLGSRVRQPMLIAGGGLGSASRQATAVLKAIPMPGLQQKSIVNNDGQTTLFVGRRATHLRQRGGVGRTAREKRLTHRCLAGRRSAGRRRRSSVSALRRAAWRCCTHGRGFARAATQFGSGCNVATAIVLSLSGWQSRHARWWPACRARAHRRKPARP